MFRPIANFFNLLNPLQWGLLVAAAAIVALYFLKLRRTPRAVPSTFLWLKAIEDVHVNSLFQRLRRNLLLLLQMIVMALVFSAFFPLSCTVQRGSGQHYVLLIDHSASMSATDVKPSRLDEAKKQALAIVEQMTHADDDAMVIAFSDQARVVCSRTRVRSEIRRAIQSITPTERPTSLLEALTVAASLANPGQQIGENTTGTEIQAELYLFTDGRFPEVQDFKIGNLKPQFVKIGQGGQNLGVAALNTRINEEQPDKLQIFGRVENYAAHNRDCPKARQTGADDDPTTACSCPAAATIAELLIDGEPKDAQNVEVQPGESKGLSFDLELLDEAVIELRLDADDDFAVDNHAWTAVNPPRAARVLVVGPPNPFLNIALGTAQSGRVATVTQKDPTFLKEPEYVQAAESNQFDLIVYDRCVPETMPQANTWFIGRLPPREGLPAPAKVQWPVLLDTDRAHPVMHYVGLDFVEIAEILKLDPPPGSHVLVQTDQGPAMLFWPREAYVDLLMTFELVSDDGKVVQRGWHTQQSFPVFVFNVLRELGRGGAALAQESTRPGQPVTLRTQDPTNTVTIVDPQANRRSITRTPQGDYIFAQAETTGAYEIQWPNREAHEHFAVNLFDPLESNILPNNELKLVHEDVPTAAPTLTVRRRFWKYFVLAALGVLLLEWYVYQRRVYF